jgi:hypothetical protein
MTLPRSAADVLADHVLFEIEAIDRMYLNLYQPRLQHGAGVAAFFVGHRGHRFASSALMAPMTAAFTADIDHFIAARGLDLVRFARGQRKDDITREYLRRAECDDRGLVPAQVLYVGVAQEKQRVFRTSKRRNPVTGATYPWLVPGSGVVNQYYFYCVDEEFGPYADRPVMPRRAVLSWWGAVLRCPARHCGRVGCLVRGCRGRPGGCRARCIALGVRRQAPAWREPVL